jgi:hypothetical protein
MNSRGGVDRTSMATSNSATRCRYDILVTVVWSVPGLISLPVFLLPPLTLFMQRVHSLICCRIQGNRLSSR